RIKHLKRSELATLPLHEVEAKHVAAYRDMRLTQVGPSSVRLELALLSHLFETAAREWSIKSPQGVPLANPVRLVRKPKAAQGRTRRWNPDDWTRLENCLEDRPKVGAWLLPVLRLLS